MGYFVLPMGDSWRDHIREARANLDLLERSEDCDYLIDFAISCLEKAKQKHPRKEAGASETHGVDHDQR